MIWIGIRELKSHFSKYVQEVRRGKEIIVTDRGRPVARLTGNMACQKTLQEKLELLEKEGTIRLARGPLRRHRGLPLPNKGKLASQMILESRR